MRENIGLYRGKRLDNDEWIEGCLVKKIDPMLGVEYCFILAQEYDTSCIDGKPTHLKSFMTWYKVAPETVGQYTGLTDKSGKKIFEGDIVRGAMGDMIVFYGEIVGEGYGFQWEGMDGKTCESMTGFIDEYEVIGNIHANPELLGGNSP